MIKKIIIHIAENVTIIIISNIYIDLSLILTENTHIKLFGIHVSTREITIPSHYVD